MKPLRLYIENFMCYQNCFIDFTQFNSALIIGVNEDNPRRSNGVGKTTIFKAIEYVLFNQSNFILEKIIREDTNYCKVVLDFAIDDQEYRVSRARSKKGNSDLSLLQRNNIEGSDEEVYHSALSSSKDGYEPFTDKVLIEKYWKNISGSRAGDTEKDLAKLIKINYKSCRNTMHFVQHDFTGLPTLTPEKRKAVLRDALNLVVYTKLEKLTKDKFNSLTKDIEKNKALIEVLGDPQKDIIDLTAQLPTVEQQLSKANDNFSIINESLLKHNNNINDLTQLSSNIENKLSSLILQEKTLTSDIKKTENFIQEYQQKKINIAKTAKDLLSNIKVLKEKQTTLSQQDYSQLEVLLNQINDKKNQIAQLTADNKNNLQKYEELSIPLPNDSVCKHCRQPMTEQHRKSCQLQINKDLEDLRHTIQTNKQFINNLNEDIFAKNKSFNLLTSDKIQLDNLNNKIIAQNKEIQDKKSLYDEYCSILIKYSDDNSNKKEELNIIKIELQNSSLQELQNIKLKIEDEKKQVAKITSQLVVVNKEINQYSNNKAILQHTIEQKNNNLLQKEELNKTITSLEEQISIYPSVLQAFSSAGIPNLIIQNVLDDLQIEANNLLSQIKPGLQLSFVVEKTQNNGVDTDTLDINYTANGKERYYEQLSGGMQMAVMFSLKLGLSFVLQKMLGVNIRFLMLDELDQPLDDASKDDFAEIIKSFQKDFTILLITHNDQLKDKFQNKILVKQKNDVSSARYLGAN